MVCCFAAACSVLYLGPLWELGWSPVGCVWTHWGWTVLWAACIINDDWDNPGHHCCCGIWGLLWLDRWLNALLFSSPEETELRLTVKCGLMFHVATCILSLWRLQRVKVCVKPQMFWNISGKGSPRLASISSLGDCSNCIISVWTGSHASVCTQQGFLASLAQMISYWHSALYGI